MRGCDVLNTHELLQVNELFVGVPWASQASIATNIGLVSRHLRGVDLQHYRAPLLTSDPSKIQAWAFDPANPHRFTVCNGNLELYEINEEARKAHQLLKPFSVISGSAQRSIVHFQYNTVVKCLLASGSNNTAAIYDLETQKIAWKLKIPTSGPKPPLLTRSVWHSNRANFYASLTNGMTLTIDPRARNEIIGTNAFHHLTGSKKSVVILPLAHENFFLSSAQYLGNLEVKLWDERNKQEPIQTIDMGSTSSPACMVPDEDCRHLFAVARGDRRLRHFSLYDPDRHAPEIILKDSYFHRTHIRQMAMTPKTQWEHHKNEFAQLLLCDGTTIETLHVIDNSTDWEQNIYAPRSPRPLTSSQNGKLNLSKNTATSSSSVIEDVPTKPTSLTSPTSPRLSEVKSPKNQCLWCGRPVSNSLASSASSQPSQELPQPFQFSMVPERLEVDVSVSCDNLLKGDELPQRKHIPITPWGDLTRDIATEFLKPDFSDSILSLDSGERYFVHRCMLAVRSPYFKKIFDKLAAENQESSNAAISSSDSTENATIIARPIQIVDFNTEIAGVRVPAIVIEKVLFYIYTDSLPVTIVKDFGDELAAVSVEWGLMQLTRWLENYRKNSDSARYYSFYLHQLKLLRTKPTLYYSDLALVAGEPNNEDLEGGSVDSALRCGACVSGPSPIRVHRLFAASRNEFIRRLLVSGLKESQTGKIELNLFSGPALQIFVSFLYSNELEAEDPNHLMDLWSVGEAYFMPNLVEAVEITLRPLVDVDNCVALYERAGKSTTYLRTFLANFISSKYDFISEESIRGLDYYFRQDIVHNFMPIKSSMQVHYSD